MSGQPSGKTLVIRPSEASLKTSDITESIISHIMEMGEVDVVGVGDAMFIVCSALNLSSEIAKIYINQMSLDCIEDPVGVKLINLYFINMRNDPAKRISAISIYLQKGISAKYSDLLKNFHQKILEKG